MQAASSRKPFFNEAVPLWVWWLVSVAFLVWVDFDGLRTWFAADDFAWLSLLRRVQSGDSLLHLLFDPAAQGTIRPWSERVFFLAFESLFGLNSLPFRIWVFLTMAANLWLFSWLTVRLTGSRVAGFFAAILWTANSALAPILSWSSAYNEVLCACFLLGALVLFVLYAETDRPVFWWCHLVVFTMGFGALEVNIVFPGLAAAWVIFVVPPPKRQKLLLSLVPSVLISIAYFLVHRALAPLPKTGVYAFAIDRRIFRTLEIFGKWSFLTPSWPDLGHSPRSGHVIFAVLVVFFASFVIRQLKNGRAAILFCLAWFLITVAPVLPIPDHRTDYYVAIPAAGLAMAAGWAFSEALWGSLWMRVTALIPLALYLGTMIPAAKVVSGWWRDRTSQSRTLVFGVEAAHSAHPGKNIVLDGIPGNLYDDVISADAFFPVGISGVYLTQKTADTIHPETALERLPDYVLSGATLRNAITHDQVVIYSFLGDHLRNVTESWERANFDRFPANGALPERVDVANPLLAYLLGPEWLPPESNFRWMPQRATVRLGGPRRPSDELLVEGYCPGQQLSQGPLHLVVSVDGIALPATQIAAPESNFRRLFRVPSSLIGRNEVVVTVSVDHTFRDPAGRDLGLVFGTIAFGAFDK